MNADFGDDDEPYDQTDDFAAIVGAMKAIGVVVGLALAGLVLWMLLG